MSLQDLQRMANLWIPAPRPYYYLIKLRMCVRCLSLDLLRGFLSFVRQSPNGNAIFRNSRISRPPNCASHPMTLPNKKPFLSSGILLPHLFEKDESQVYTAEVQARKERGFWTRIAHSFHRRDKGHETALGDADQNRTA